MVYILLGLMPFTVEVLPEQARPNIEWRGVPFITGVFTTVIQFMAGVGGLFLDIFFNKSRLDRNNHQRHQGNHPDLQPRAARGLFRFDRRHRRPAVRGPGDRGIVLALVGAGGWCRSWSSA